MKDKIEKIEKEIRQLSGEIRVRSFLAQEVLIRNIIYIIKDNFKEEIEEFENKTNSDWFWWYHC